MLMRSLWHPGNGHTWMAPEGPVVLSLKLTLVKLNSSVWSSGTGVQELRPMTTYISGTSDGGWHIVGAQCLGSVDGSRDGGL